MGGKGKKFRGNAPSNISDFQASHTSIEKGHHTSRHEKLLKHSQHSQYPQQIVHSRKHSSNSRLPIQLKHPLKLHTSSVKRSRMSGSSSNVSAAKLKLSGPTGLEDILDLSKELGLTKLSAMPLAASLRYQIRDKHAEWERRRTNKARASRVVKRQRALSTITCHNQKTIIARQKGMRNLTGALCYRHSLFQALLHSPMFTNWLQLHDRADNCVEPDQENCVACVMRGITVAYRIGNSAALDQALTISNTLFKHHHWKTDTGSGHGDPQEQFTFITKMFENQLPNATYRIFQASRCLLVDSVIKCNACGHESGTRENVMGFLHVGLRPRAQDGKLASYIANNMSEKVIGYKCENCKNDADKRRNHQIGHSPDLLMVQLMRFNAGFSGSGKDSTPVEFGTRLDLDRYRSPLNKHNSTYQLLAVVMHSGSSGFGHYTCSARGADGEWYHFDDDHVSKINAHRATSPGKGWTPYLMFYMRNKD